MLSPESLYDLLVFHENPASSLSSMVITGENARTMFELAAGHIEIACSGVTDPACAAAWRAIEDAVRKWSDIGIIDLDVSECWETIDDWLEDKWTELRTEDGHVDAPIAYGVLFYRSLWAAYDQQLTAMRAAADFTGTCPFAEIR